MIGYLAHANRHLGMIEAISEILGREGTVTVQHTSVAGVDVGVPQARQCINRRHITGMLQFANKIGGSVTE
jgi:hypothetical protein